MCVSSCVLIIEYPNRNINYNVNKNVIGREEVSASLLLLSNLNFITLKKRIKKSPLVAIGGFVGQVPIRLFVKPLLLPRRVPKDAPCLLK